MASSAKSAASTFRSFLVVAASVSLSMTSRACPMVYPPLAGTTTCPYCPTMVRTPRPEDPGASGFSALYVDPDERSRPGGMVARAVGDEHAIEGDLTGC